MSSGGGTRTNVGDKVGKGAVLDTRWVAVGIGGGQAAEVACIGEHGGLGKLSGVEGLIPPDHGAVEATLGAEHLLESPQVVSVPDQELGVVVHVVHVVLVETDEVLVPRLGGREVTRGRLVHETLDSGNKRQAVRVRVLPPLIAHVRVRTAGGRVGAGDGGGVHGIHLGELARGCCRLGLGGAELGNICGIGKALDETVQTCLGVGKGNGLEFRERRVGQVLTVSEGPSLQDGGGHRGGGGGQDEGKAHGGDGGARAIRDY